MHCCGSAYGLDVAGRVLALAEQKLNIIQATCSNKFWLWRGWSAAISAEKAVSTALAFDLRQRRMILKMFQPGQVVRVNLAGLQAEGVMFQAAVTDAVGPHCQTDLGTAAHMPRKAIILLSWHE